MVNGVFPVASYQIKVITPLAGIAREAHSGCAFCTPVNVATAGYMLSLK